MKILNKFKVGDFVTTTAYGEFWNKKLKVTKIWNTGEVSACFVDDKKESGCFYQSELEYYKENIYFKEESDKSFSVYINDSPVATGLDARQAEIAVQIAKLYKEKT